MKKIDLRPITNAANDHKMMFVIVWMAMVSQEITLVMMLILVLVINYEFAKRKKMTRDTKNEIRHLTVGRFENKKERSVIQSGGYGFLQHILWIFGERTRTIYQRNEKRQEKDRKYGR